MTTRPVESPIDGLWKHENDRNADNSALFQAIIREAYDGVNLVVAGHHLIYTREGHAAPEEFPSADSLIFNHYVAQKIWKDDYRAILARLALEPTRTRDALLGTLYHGRPQPNSEQV